MRSKLFQKTFSLLEFSFKRQSYSTGKYARHVIASKDADATISKDGCSYTNGKKLRVAIIGAGFAGLCAARHVFAEGSGMTGVVFEQTSNIGGTWVYSDETGRDRYGIPIHSSLYHDLWTNLPKESMSFPDFKYPDMDKSYISSAEVLQYIVSYADHFNLHPHIKLNHIVRTISPYGKSWSVTVTDLARKIDDVSVYDAIMVCSGPNIIPLYPTIEGLARFSGKQLHSKEFRRAQPFAGKTVLVIGLGPSGIDITFKLMEHAKQVILSHNKPRFKWEISKQIKVKPEVASLEDKTITFVDGTSEEVDVIIYCTGYTYHFPFLTKQCGLIVDQCVTPLYKHFINIEHPTMAVIGLPKPVPQQYMVDYQVRTFLNILNGKVKLPEKAEMEKEVEDLKEKLRKNGIKKKYLHQIKPQEGTDYFKQLWELGNLQPMAPVHLKLFYDAFNRAIRDFDGFRDTTYKVIDDENFESSHALPGTPERKDSGGSTSSTIEANGESETKAVDESSTAASSTQFESVDLNKNQPETKAEETQQNENTKNTFTVTAEIESRPGMREEDDEDVSVHSDIEWNFEDNNNKTIIKSDEIVLTEGIEQSQNAVEEVSSQSTVNVFTSVENKHEVIEDEDSYTTITETITETAVIKKEVIEVQAIVETKRTDESIITINGNHIDEKRV